MRQPVVQWFHWDSSSAANPCPLSSGQREIELVDTRHQPPKPSAALARSVFGKRIVYQETESGSYRELRNRSSLLKSERASGWQVS